MKQNNHQHQQQQKAVEFNIGGKTVAVSPNIADKFPNCRLARLLSGRELAGCVDSTGRPFLDRNPAVFGMALDFLRHGGRFLPPCDLQRFDDWERLEAEAEYLQLPELAAQLRTLQRDREGASASADLPRRKQQSSLQQQQQQVAFLEVGESEQAVFLEGADPQRQLVLLGELGALREVLRKRLNPLLPRLMQRADELSERRGRRLHDADSVSLSLPEGHLRERGLGSLDEFRPVLLREVARLALPGPPGQLTLSTGEHRLLFRVPACEDLAN
ncbi:hypothetical protein BOX15_Mlig023614g1 [Macrostomum lignano]|uniref:Potassium channel tetramerisation-type BTB domain-containing protein n=1 Tax=Macrostomum lignano TaxID=282301 RepID=A0A267GXA3_9PLAT|nr:hypothetical protein BOX15_Mlig023614g2 [Macrostomum lignano]PAA89947.1 hypothetical protein BOX15_Mlig023614g1 [Macrostomum lignano]